MRIQIFAILLFCTTLGLAQIPEQPSDYVTDAAGVLSDEEEDKLNKKLKDFEEKTTNQIFVLLTNTSGNEDFMELSEKTAEKWKIGQKGKDNGVFVAIFIDDRKLAIQVGYGLEGAIPDALTADIRLNQMNPYLKKKEYYEAVDHGTDALMQASKGEYVSEAPHEKEVLSQEEEIARNQRVGLIISLIAGLVFSGIILLIFRNKFNKLNEKEDTEANQKERKKLTRRAYWIGSVYVIFLLFVLNGYVGEIFGDMKKVLPIILVIPLFGFFIFHLLVLLLDLLEGSAISSTYSGSGRSRSSWSSSSSSSSSFGGGGGGSFGGGGSGGSW
jgi:uncharacterized protein